MQGDVLLHIWWLAAAMLVFMMQVGFLLLETGLIQERHMAGIAVKSMMMLLASSTAFTLFGFHYMWANANAAQANSGEWQFYQTGFAAVAATILSGALAGRTTLISNVIMATLVGGILFPLHGRWVWGDGYPRPDIHVHDFAGSGCVHLLGGLVALAGTIVAGPRTEKKDMSSEDPIHITPRSLPMAACGVLFLWIGWMGFNAGSILTADRLNTIGRLVISTCLAASAGGFSVCCVAALLRLLSQGGYVFAPYATLSGIMAGMVANSACCDLIANSSWKPLIVGAAGGLVAYATNWLLQRVYRIDDPIEAIAVHAGGGVVGLIFAGLYQSPTHLWPQLFDIAVLITIAFVPSYLMFYVIDLLAVVKIGTRIPIRLKSTAMEENLGLIFDDPISRVGQPPIIIHYLPRDLQKGFTDSLLLLIAAPLHVARSLNDSARALVDEMKALFSKRAEAKLALKKLDLLVEDLAHRIDSMPDVINRLATGRGEPICLTTLIQDIAKEYRERYTGIVDVRLSPLHDDIYVQGDYALTQQAIRIVISNGVRACIDKVERRGSMGYEPAVEIKCEKKDEVQQVLLRIRDNGIGIDPEVRHYLGQPFAGLKRSGRGSGLGLFFAAYITQAFGGRIDCISTSPQPPISIGGGWTEFVMQLTLDGGANAELATVVKTVS